MDPWASPWAEEDSAAPPQTPAAIPPARQSSPPTHTRTADIDPWATGSVETPAPVVERRPDSPVAQHTSTSDDTSWPTTQTESTTQDPWAAEQVREDDHTSTTTAAETGWGDNDGPDGISGMPQTWQPAVEIQPEPVSPPQSHTEPEEETNADDPWASAPSKSAKPVIQPVRPPIVPASMSSPVKPTPKAEVPAAVPNTTTAPPPPTDPDSGPGWEMKKKQGAAAFADKLGGWMRGAVSRGESDSNAPQIASAQDEDEEEEQVVQEPKRDFFEDTNDAQPQGQPQQQTAMGRFLGRWRAKPEEKQHAEPAPAVDADGLDWLSAQAGSSASMVAPAAPPVSNALDFDLGDSIGSRYPAGVSASTSPSRKHSAFPTSSTQRGVQRRPVVVAPPSQPSRDPFDFSEFERATPSTSAAVGRTATQYPGRIVPPPVQQRQQQPQQRPTPDPFAVFEQKQPPTRVAQPSRPQVQAPPLPSFYSGKAQGDDELERSGFDYREDDESADDWGWGVEETGGAYSDKPSPRSKPLPPTKLHQAAPSPPLPNLGFITLNRAASLSSAPASRPSSTANKRASLLPPPPPGRNHAQVGRGQALARSSSSSSGGASTSQQQQQPQQTSRPSSSLSRGTGMTSDDLAFFEGL